MCASLAGAGVAYRPTWREYCSLLRFRYHISFLVVLLGSLSVEGTLPLQLAPLYVSFNLLLYGGIYTLHCASDCDLDRLHSRKRLRPVASGAISRQQAIALGLILVSSGLLSGSILFSSAVGAVYLAVLLCNALYSVFGRQIPYLELALNAGTYPLRLMLGIVVAGGRVTFPPVALTFLVALGGATLRRRLELGAGGVRGRPVMSAYSSRGLRAIEITSFCGIVGLGLADTVTPVVFYLVATTVHAIAVLLPQVCSPVRRFWERYWSV